MYASSLYNGAAGIKAHTRALESVADNMANINTPGYKSTRASFEDLLYNELNNGQAVEQAGNGSMAFVENLMQQTSLQSTESPTDLAINGAGFFTVEDPQNANELYYSRAGEFHVDQDSKIVNPQGYILQGYGVDDQGNINKNALVDLEIPVDEQEAKATTAVDLGINLNASDLASHAANKAIDPTDTSTYNTITNFETVDAKGETHYFAIYHQRLAGADGAVTRTYKCAIYEIEDGELTANPAAPNNMLYMQFSDTGALTGVSKDGNNYQANGEAQYTFNYGDAGNQAVTLDYSPEGKQASTMLGGSNETFYKAHNGFGKGSLTGIDIDKNGLVTADFSSGESRLIGAICLTTFKSPTSLTRVGNTLWQANADAGLPQREQPGDEDLALGTLKSYALENSSVDMSNEFVNMINYQRAFQANSKAVTTTDEMLKTALNLKS